MAQLFVKDQDREWAVLPVDGAGYLLSVHPPRRIDDPKQVKLLRSQVILMPGTDGRWLLLWGASRDVRLNGIPQTLGLRVLEHRDEIRVGGVETVYFSAEKLAGIEAFPGSDRRVYCARCKAPLTQGEPSVQCPGCGLWYHQTEEHPCWVYGEHCVYCPQPTALDGRLRWTPEES